MRTRHTACLCRETLSALAGTLQESACRPHPLKAHPMNMTDPSTIIADEAAIAALVQVGERIEHVAHYTRDEISRFATLTLDLNPVPPRPRGGAARRPGRRDRQRPAHVRR